MKLVLLSLVLALICPPIIYAVGMYFAGDEEYIEYVLDNPLGKMSAFLMYLETAHMIETKDFEASVTKKFAYLGFAANAVTFYLVLLGGTLFYKSVTEKDEE